MAADRVPAKDQVWALRFLRALNRGRVTILDVDVPLDRVSYRYHGSGTSNDSTIGGFVTAYDFLAVDEPSAVDLFGPQVQPGVRRLVDMPASLGTAVK